MLIDPEYFNADRGEGPGLTIGAGAVRPGSAKLTCFCSDGGPERR